MRELAFGENKLSLLDKIIFFLRIRRIRSYLHDCDTIIDMGCGYRAGLLRWILNNFKIKQCIGVDLSVDERLTNEHLKFIKSDLNYEQPIEENTADFVISTAVIEHLSNPVKYAQELFRILKPGGKLLLTTPSKSAKPVLEFLAFKLRVIDREEINDHKYYFNINELKQLLISCGWSKDDIAAKTFLFGLNNFIYAKKYDGLN